MEDDEMDILEQIDEKNRNKSIRSILNKPKLSKHELDKLFLGM